MKTARNPESNPAFLAISELIFQLNRAQYAFLDQLFPVLLHKISKEKKEKKKHTHTHTQHPGEWNGPD